MTTLHRVRMTIEYLGGLIAFVVGVWVFAAVFHCLGLAQ